jgi:hypothetical protein
MWSLILLLIRLLKPFLGALLLAVSVNSSSSAAIVTIGFEDKATGADSAGIFLAPNTSFSAVNFSASTTFDTATLGALIDRASAVPLSYRYHLQYHHLGPVGDLPNSLTTSSEYFLLRQIQRLATSRPVSGMQPAMLSC